ncbi:rhodanese-like domain-containing protein [Edwardsiella tarda]|uniref:rhodanese-like domain-containing protein n=1 Tax=Edwardsiella tarda TaxID=636 RepID=UPI00351C2631
MVRYPLFGLCLTLSLFSPIAVFATHTHTHTQQEQEPTPISMRAAESLLGQPNVYFLDVNTPEIWHRGRIPGAIYINQENWQSLLPHDRQATLIFYCANQLCLASHDAAKMSMALGYHHVFHMADGIFGWITSGRPTEKDDSPSSTARH